MNRLRGTVACALTALLAAGCELTETSATEPEDALVAEVFVDLGPSPAEHRIVGWIHGTVGGAASRSGEAEFVDMRITGPRGVVIDLAQTDPEVCVDQDLVPPDGFGDCYVGDPSGTAAVRPGDRLELSIVRASGGTVRGVSTVPGAFELRRPAADGETCAVPPSTLVDILWTSSAGARAYVSETVIFGLGAALSVPDADSLELLGLSISATDTSIVFPAEFGVFDRFDLDREIAVALQAGLPVGTSASVFVAATDQNYVNWARGGSFNPSGQVRIPSLQGDGFGVFGSTLRRSLRIEQTDDAPACQR